MEVKRSNSQIRKLKTKTLNASDEGPTAGQWQSWDKNTPLSQLSLVPLPPLPTLPKYYIQQSWAGFPHK